MVDGEGLTGGAGAGFACGRADGFGAGPAVKVNGSSERWILPVLAAWFPGDPAAFLEFCVGVWLEFCFVLPLSCAIAATEVTSRQVVAKTIPKLFALFPESPTDFALRSLLFMFSTFPPDSGFAKVELSNNQPS